MDLTLCLTYRKVQTIKNGKKKNFEKRTSKLKQK